MYIQVTLKNIYERLFHIPAQLSKRHPKRNGNEKKSANNGARSLISQGKDSELVSCYYIA